MTEQEQGEEIAEIHVFKNRFGIWELWVDNTQYPNRTLEEVLDIIKRRLSGL